MIYFSISLILPLNLALYSITPNTGLWTENGVQVLQLELWKHWVTYRPHPRYPDTMKWRNVFFTQDGHAILRGRDPFDIPSRSDEFSDEEECAIPLPSSTAATASGSDSGAGPSGLQTQRTPQVVPDLPPPRRNPSFLGPRAFSMWFDELPLDDRQKYLGSDVRDGGAGRLYGRYDLASRLKPTVRKKRRTKKQITRTLLLKSKKPKPNRGELITFLFFF